MSYMMQPGQVPNTTGYGQQFSQPQTAQQPMGNWQALCSISNGVLSNMLVTNQLPQQYAGFVQQRLSAEINSPMMQQQLMMTFGNRQAQPQELQQFCINLIRNYMDQARAQMGNGYNNGYNNGYGQMYQQQPSGYYNQYQPQPQPMQQFGGYGQQPQYDSFGRPMYPQQQTSNYYNQQYRPNPYQNGMHGSSGPASVYERAQQTSVQNQAAQYAAPDLSRPQTYSSQQQVATAQSPSQPVEPRRHHVQIVEERVGDPKYITDEKKKAEIEKELESHPNIKLRRYFRVTAELEKFDPDSDDNDTAFSVATSNSEIKEPSKSIEEIVAELKSVKAINEEQFATVTDVEEPVVIDEPAELMAAKFDAVNEVAADVDIVIHKDKVNNTEVTDYHPYVEGTCKVLKAIRAQGAAFSVPMERQIVKDFNDALRILWTIDKDDGGRVCVNDCKNFADIEDLITSINDPVMRMWDDENSFYLSVRRCLDYSLYSIFGKNRRGYLDAKNPDDLTTIVNNSHILVEGKTARSMLMSGNVSEDNRKKLVEAAEDIFVFCVRRRYCYTNLEFEFEPEIGGVNDFDKHVMQDNKMSKFLMQFASLQRVPLRVVNKFSNDDLKHPKLFDVSFSGKLMAQRIIP